MSDNNAENQSSYNAFGHDPFGKIAHICHYFFGPEWQPTSQIHLERIPITDGQPRYGQPAPTQMDQLPESFTPRPPPLYFGTPTPPYIDGPLVFDPKLFARIALCLLPSRRNTDPSKALCYKKIHGTEVMNGVYRLDVKLAVGYEDYRLSLLSNMPWASFQSHVQDRLGIGEKSLQLFYNVRDTLYGSESGSKPLRGEEDWADVMAEVRQAFDCYRDLELEILHKDVEHQEPFIEETPDSSFQLETFYFQYPCVNELAVLMSERFPVGQALENHEYDLVRSNGIEYLDDFTLVSAWKLQFWTSIPMEKIRALYTCAEVMIKEFHDRKAKEIREIREIREYRMSSTGCPEGK